MEKHPFSEKCLPFKKISGHFRAKEICTPVLICLQSLFPINVNQHSKELRWLVRAGKLLQSECLLKNTLAATAPLPRSGEAHGRDVS